MQSIFRIQPRLRTTTSILPSIYRTPISQPSWSRYAHSSYGGEGESESPGRSRTRDMEHPGPPPPGQSKDASSSSSLSSKKADQPSHTGFEDDIQTIPSNKAHPTITDGKQSPNVDEKGNQRPDVPEDVKKHNEDMDNRYDHSYNQIADEGKVRRGYWSDLNKKTS